MASAARPSIKLPVMASAARPSIFEVRGDGLPRYARSDENFYRAVTGVFIGQRREFFSQ